MVSIIITTYKRPVEMVLRAVESVRNQTYKDIEIIVVDDSPADFEERQAVKEAIEKIEDERIIYLANEKNVGACASRNRGISIAKGEFIMYVDDDDELVETCVEKRVAKFAQSDAGLVYSDCYLLDEESGTMKNSNQDKHSGFVFDKLILKNFILAFPTIRKECFEKCGGFDESMPAAQDYEMWLRIAKDYKVDYVPEPLSVIHLHSGERISTNWEKKAQGSERIREIYADYLKTHRYARYKKTMVLVNYHIRLGNRKKAFRLWFSAVCTEPLRIVNNLRNLSYFFKNI